MEHYPVLSSSASQMPQTISKKPPPLHKKHTKPCKYYQVGRCPYPADVCNFAHVLLPSAKDGKSDTVCRYYAAGTCHNGSQCRYRHPNDGDVPPPYKPDVLQVHIPETRAGWHGLSSPPDKVPVYGSGYPSNYYSPVQHDWSYANGISAQSPVYLPLYQGSPTQSGHPMMGPGSKEDNSRHFHHHHHHYSAPAPLQPLAASPLTASTSRSSRDSATSSATQFSFDDLRERTGSAEDPGLTSSSTGSSSSLSSSESPSTESDDELIIATTEDPKYAEHGHEYQSRVVVLDQPGPVHVPPPPLPVFYHGGVAPGVAAGRYAGAVPPPMTQPTMQEQQQAYQRQMQQPQPQSIYYRTGTPSRYGASTPGRGSVRENGSNPVSRNASRNSQRIKPSKYKTKPCKFFAMEGSCPSGDECTFRHDEPYPPPVPPLPLGIMTMKPYPYIQPNFVKPQRTSPPPAPPPPRIRNDVNRTRKSNATNNDDEKLKKEFFPIAWRVIGGGVRIGTTNSSQKGDDVANSDISSSESVPPSDSSDGDEFEYVQSDLVRGGGDHGAPQTPPATAKRASTHLHGSEADGTPSESGGGSPSNRLTRKRSNSIPMTPSSPHFIVGNLFSAESPGVL